MVAFVASIYAAVGLVFSLVGPAARELRWEMVGIEAMPEVPTWKRHAFRLALMAGIVVLWPALVPAAARVERVRAPARAAYQFPVDPSRKARAQIRRIQDAPPKTITLEEYQAIGHGFAWFDRQFLEKAMAERGYLVAMARTEEGEVVPVRFSVANYIGQPIVLSQDAGGRWEFSTHCDSWEHLAGRSGFAVIRDGVVEDVHVTVMS